MDEGQKATEKELKKLEARINKEYKQAIDEIEDELTDYLRRYEKKDETWRKWVEDGTKTQKEYEQWRLGQMAVGKRWNDQKEIIAHQLFKVSEDAKNKIKSICPEVYADNYNYSITQVANDAHIVTSFDLYSKESIEILIERNPEVLPPVGKKVAKQIAEGKAVRWNRQQLQSVMIQGIMQGDSIPKLATRLANTVGDRDRKASIRNARTMATSAQNAGRVAAYKRAQDKGVDLEQMWIATLDGRTRHSHRWLDGEVRPVGEAFSNGCEYPADPKGDPAEIYNCRCTLRGVVRGLERRSGKYRDTSAIDGMSYDEWRNAKPKYNSITLPEEKGKAIKLSYIREYMDGIMKVPDTLDESALDNLIDAFSKIPTSGTLATQCFKKVKWENIQKLETPLTTSQIIKKIASKDVKCGSCASLTWAYLGNKAGYDIYDFRGGDSRELFANRPLFERFLKDNGIKYNVEQTYNDAVGARRLLATMEEGKEYILRAGTHAAVVRVGEKGYEYLELQSASEKKNGFKPLDINVLKSRFGCKEENRYLGIKYKKDTILVDADSMEQNDAFILLLGYVNTPPNKKKGR